MTKEELVEGFMNRRDWFSPGATGIDFTILREAILDLVSASLPAAKPTGCAYEGCGNKHLAKGYCRNHYQRFHKNGTPEPKARFRFPLTTPEGKVCRSCNTLKNLRSFHVCNSSSDKLASWCTECKKVYNTAHAEKRRQRRKERKLARQAENR